MQRRTPMRSRCLSQVIGRVRRAHKAGYVVALLALMSGCATFDPQAGFSDVRADVEARSGMGVAWNLGTELDAQVAQKVSDLLAGKLTTSAAVQVALLNNRDLQTVYAELGVAQADLVQAGLLKNPIFDFSATLPLSGGGPNLELATAMDFLGIFYMPLRQRVAAARFEDAKFQVTGAVLDFTATVRAAAYRHQANEQILELRQAILHGLTVSLEVTQRLHDVGNITDLDLARERALMEEAKLQLGAAEVTVRQSREQLNILMGLWGQQTAWEIERRLSDIPEQPMPTDHELRLSGRLPPAEGLEHLALRRSIDLASVKQRMIVAGEQAGFSRATALVPEAHLGARAERDDGAWEVGPTIEFPIPLFDQGQARLGRALSELRRIQQEYYALGVRIRSTVRAARDRLQGAWQSALYYRDIMLPLRERIVNETQLQYNAMQLGVFEILQAQERQVLAAVAYIETLLDYWLARTHFEQILSGRLPQAGGLEMGRRERATRGAENGGH